MSLEFATFVTVEYAHSAHSVLLDDKEQARRPASTACAGHACALLMWLRQVQRLATGVHQAVRQPTSVHAWTECLDPAVDGAALAAGGAPVVLHRLLEPLLRAAMRSLRERGRQLGRKRSYWGTAWLMNLAKWVLVSCVHAHLAVFVDLDMEVLPRLGHLVGLPSRDAQVVAAWTQLLQCAMTHNASLFTHGDHSAPVNTAFIIVKPSAARYSEGIAVLERASQGAFNESHGWDLVGRPRNAVPSVDDSWRSQQSMQMRDENHWAFVCASLDQGHFFYVFRVRRSEGVDLRYVACCAHSSSTGRVHPGALLHHYGGTNKPWQTLEPAASCDEPRSRGRWRMADTLRRMVGKPRLRARGGAEYMGTLLLARALSWGRRAQSELSELPFVASVQSCRALLDRGLQCIHGGLQRWNVTPTARDTRIWLRRSRQRGVRTAHSRRGAYDASGRQGPSIIISERDAVRADDYVARHFEWVDQSTPTAPEICGH